MQKYDNSGALAPGMPGIRQPFDEMDAAGGLKLNIANLWVAVTDFQELGTVVKRGRSMDF